MENLNIAIISFEAIAGNIEKNLRRTEEIAIKATKEHADIIFFPETALTGYSSSNNIKSQAIEIPSATINELCRISKENQTTIITGLHEKRQHQYFITQIVVANGEIKGIYRKTHLSFNESKVLSTGNEIPVFETPKCRFGIQLCYDTHFPEISTIQALQKADILFMAFATPGSNPESLTERLMRFLKARAYDNSCFVVYTNLKGTGREGQKFSGISGVIDPKGNVIGDNLSSCSELLFANLNPTLLNKIKSSHMGHFLAHRRSDLY